MACIITYKNNKYSQQEFEKYFKNNFNEFVNEFLSQDLEGFKEFVNKYKSNNIKSDNIEKNNEYSKEQIDILTEFYNKTKNILDLEKDINENIEDYSFFNRDTFNSLINRGLTFKNLSFKELDQITDWLYHSFINDKKTDTKPLIDRLNTELDYYKNQKNIFETKFELNERISKLIKSADTQIGKLEEALNNIEYLSNEAKKKIAKYTKLKEIENDFIQFDNELTDTQRAYDVSNLNENSKKGASYLLKRFYNNILKTNSNGAVRKGIFDLELYEDYDTVDDYVKYLLADQIEANTDFETMLSILELYKDHAPFIKPLIEKLKTATEQEKNLFTSENHRHNLSMIFSSYSKRKDNGKYIIKTMYSNANSINRVMRQKWEANLFNNRFIYYSDEAESWMINSTLLEKNINEVLEKHGFNSKNKTLREKLNQVSEIIAPKRDWNNLELHRKNNQWNQYFKLKKHLNDVSSKHDNFLIDFLDIFGISLSEESLSELKRDGYKDINGNIIEFGSMFNISSNSYGIFGQLFEKSISYVLSEEDIAINEDNTNSPFSDLNSILYELAKIEGKNSQYTPVISFRTNGKSIDGRPLHKLATETISRLKNEEEYRNMFLNKFFTKNSFILNLLNSDPKFRKVFNINHFDPISLKEMYKKVYRDNDFVSLTDKDMEFTKLISFMDRNEFHKFNYNGLNFEVANMTFPAMSDKSQMLALSTAVLNINKESFDEFGNLKEEILDFLFTQLVLPEINRIQDSFKNEYNIKNYKEASKLFYMIPALNNIKYPEGNHLSPDKLFSDEKFLKFLKSKSKEIINKIINKKVEEKVKLWEKYFDNNLFDIDFIKYKKGSIKNLAYDYIINTFLTNSNIFSLFTGDIAQYNNISPKNMNKLLLDEKIPQAIRNTVDINLGKRLSLLLAPAKKLANSENEKYLQLILEDKIDISSSIKTIATILDRKTITDNDIEVIRKYNNGDTTVKDSFENLVNKFPKASYFFNIKSTDAQEYTTALEHLEIKHRIGEIDDNYYNSMKNKIEQQQQYNGKQIPKNLYLNSNELKFFFNPIKPVYAGFVEEGDLMRMIYIKSSSFPLLPQLTQGNELDKLRVIMENIENSQQKRVRASYQTANKVGTLTKGINMFDNNGKFKNELTENDFLNNSLLLNRKDFGIQQNTPLKFPYNDSDYISLGTQLWKLFFGNGLDQINTFDFQSNLYSEEDLISMIGDSNLTKGENLRKLHDRIFIDLVNRKRDKLLNELYLDKNFKSTDTLKTLLRLKNIVKKEAELRDYPKKVIESLELIARVKISFNNKHGEREFTIDEIKKIQEKDKVFLSKLLNTEYNNEDITIGEISNIQFNVPLWLSPTSDRFESLLNSIVSNRLINLKLPGRSFILGSEALFDLDTTSENRNNIIYTSKYDFNLGKLKHTTRDENTGELSGSQVFIPSIFRDNNGDIIRFIYEDGSYNEDYVYKDENGFLRLKEDKVDLELLSNTSFRIPTSGHVSMSNIEIAGILPIEYGDLMIVNESLITQKGLDFDVDKEYMYSLNTIVNKENKIEVLTKNNIQDVKNKFKDDLNNLNTQKEIFEYVSNTDFGKDIMYMINEDIYNTEKDFKKFISDIYSGKIDEKLYENELLRIYNHILSNPDTAVQKRILKSLNMDFAKSQAELLTENTQQDLFWTLLDDEHQKFKIGLGSSGKDSIGRYSNSLTFHSLLQQYYSSFENNFDVLGNFSNLSLGQQDISKPNDIPEELWNIIKTSISESFEEKQNTATDNEKEQILGRVNVNMKTIGIDTYLTLNGAVKDYFEISKEDYEKDNTSAYKINNKYYRVISYPYFFISQPIIKEYIKRLSEKESNLEEFDRYSKEKIIRELYDEIKYDPENLSINYKYINGEYLFNAIKDNIYNTKLQGDILTLFLDISKKNNEITEFNSLLSINRNGLDKSFLNVIDKKNQLLKSYNNKFNSLIGEYLVSEEYSEKEGFIYIGENSDGLHISIKPTTPIGNMLVQSVMTGYNLFKDYFPFESNITNKTFNKLSNLLTNEETSPERRVELKQMIFKEFKKFIFSSKSLGLFDTSISNERIRLLINNIKENKESLGYYLEKNIKNIENLKDNPLINSLIFITDDIKTVIKFNNTKQENFDEDYLYKSLNDLILTNQELPDFNGEKYNTTKLALDLVSYSYITGGIQEATQFIKYIPNEILESTSFAKKVRKWNQVLQGNNIFNETDKNNEEYITNRMEEFLQQFIQHNPSLLLNKLTLNNLEELTNKKFRPKSGTNGLISFSYDSKTPYIAIYNPYIKKGLNKYMIFKYNGSEYERISTLGVNFIDEYNLSENNAKSLFNEIYDIEKEKKPIDSKKYNSGIGNLNEINIFKLFSDGKIEDIVKYYININDESYITKALKYLLDNNLLDKNVKISADYLENKNGTYNREDNSIIINYKMLYGPNNNVAKVLLKELVHNLTINHLKNNPESVEALNLKILFNNFKNTVSKEDLDRVKNKIKNRETLSKEEKLGIYPATNIFEFIEVLFTEEEAQEKLKNIPYLKSDLNIFEKFIEIIKNLFNKLGNGNFSSEVIENILLAINENAKNMNSNLDKANEILSGKIIEDKEFIQSDDKNESIIEIADGFIGQIIDKNSPNYTSAIKIYSKLPSKIDRTIGEVAKTTNKAVHKEVPYTVYSLQILNARTEDSPAGGKIASKIIMLARDYEFKGQDISDSTKKEILNAYNNGAEFIVGDIPEVDSQFIDYLQEIGAKFTIYHTKNREEYNDIQENIYDNIVYKYINNLIQSGEITYTNENKEKCAINGITNTTKGTNWKIVKDFKGKPKHSQGGVDITISNKGVTMRRDGKDIKAKYGLLITNNK